MLASRHICLQDTPAAHAHTLFGSSSKDSARMSSTCEVTHTANLEKSMGPVHNVNIICL